MYAILMPLPLVNFSASRKVFTVPLTEAIFKISGVNGAIAQKFCPLAVVLALFPHAIVLLASCKLKNPLAAILVVLEFPLVAVAVGMGELALAMHFAFAPISLVTRAIWPSLFAEAMLFAKP